MKNWKTDMIFHFFNFWNPFSNRRQPPSARLGPKTLPRAAPWSPTIEKMKNWKNERLKNGTHFSIFHFWNPFSKHWQPPSASLGPNTLARETPVEPNNWKNEKMKNWKTEPIFQFFIFETHFPSTGSPRRPAGGHFSLFHFLTKMNNWKMKNGVNNQKSKMKKWKKWIIEHFQKSIIEIQKPIFELQ